MLSEVIALKTLPKGGETPESADFALTLSSSELAPYAKRGEVIYLRRQTGLADGEVGLFCLDGRAVLRQYAEDSEGNIYLFAVNRRLKRLDRTIPRGEDVTLLGKALLPKIPLP